MKGKGREFGVSLKRPWGNHDIGYEEKQAELHQRGVWRQGLRNVRNWHSKSRGKCHAC